MFDIQSIQNHNDTVFFGTFTLSDCTETLDFNCAFPKRSTLAHFGDVVYFMFVEGELVKIGKAGGAAGFSGRSRGYTPTNPKYNDATNNLIIRQLKEMNADTIEVWAIPSPRATVTTLCPLSGLKKTVEIETAKGLEADLTEMAMAEGYELPFCIQKK